MFKGNSGLQFIQQFKLYLTAIGANAKSGVQKVAMLLTVAGPGSIDIYNTFVLTEAEAKEFDTVVLRFEEHCAPRTNEVFDRGVTSPKFWNRVLVGHYSDRTRVLVVIFTWSVYV